MIDRRTLIKGSGALAAAFGPLQALAQTVTMPFENGVRPLVKYPQKRPMIGLTSRPPQLETPFSVFNDGVITPNDAFFVRYHLAGIPLEIDPDTHTIEIKGKLNKPLKLTLAALKRMPSVEIVAVNQCSGNSRGFVEPRVTGGQSGNGAMGNARWRGVTLKSVLDQAGVQAAAKQVVFKGLDTPIVDKTPVFEKALDIAHARDGEVMLAYAMNGQDIPFLHTAKELTQSHQEKWDGTGYPNGLSGDQIPVSARLMAIADVYDALINDRVYKAGVTHTKAVQIIFQGRGSHFDPDMVDAFIEIQDEFRLIAQCYADSEADMQKKIAYLADAIAEDASE